MNNEKENTYKVIHDDSIVGVHQDPLTGDVILGKPKTPEWFNDWVSKSE